MNGIEDKITSLKELLLEQDQKKNIFGFAGGIQSITIWGIILVVISCIAFLYIYFSALRSEIKIKKVEQAVTKTETELRDHDALYHPTPKYRHKETPLHKGHKIARIASIVLLLSGVGSVLTSLTIKASRNNPVALVSPSPDAAVLGTTTSEKVYPYQAALELPTTKSIPVRSRPSITAPELFTLKENQTVFVFRSLDGWVQIGLTDKDSGKNWWINASFLVKQ
jgi:hypothetical protein